MTLALGWVRHSSMRCAQIPLFRKYGAGFMAWICTQFVRVLSVAARRRHLDLWGRMVYNVDVLYCIRGLSRNDNKEEKMNSKKKDIRYTVSVALMAAIVVLLANTPLGMIQLPIIKATTVHIPVIIGAIILGPAAGAILGCVFGICSIISNTTAPTLLSFAFSPFLSTTGIVGAVKAVWIAVGCRILIGVAAGWLWILLKKIKVPSPVGLAITGFVGSMVNTICVMGSIYVLFAAQYAQAKEVEMAAVFGLVMGTVTASGIPEAIAAAILVDVIGIALLKALGIEKNVNAKKEAVEV